MGANTEGSNATILEVRNLVKSYGHVEVLRGITMSVPRGKATTVIGRSGSGKSTLLRCIALLEEFQSGEVLINGRRLGYEDTDSKLIRFRGSRLASERARIGMVFQHFNLFPHLTVLENIIEAPIHVKHVSRGDAIAKAGELLEKIQLSDRAHNYPATLSGGEQQRVAIARALAMEPEVLLFDEPTSSLDPELIGEVLELMQRVAAEGMTMLVVTHEMSFARDVSSHVVFLDEGRIVEQGDPKKMFSNPDNPETRLFLRSLLSNTG
jgi:polar amino acid transport system ATP-binding protein